MKHFRIEFLGPDGRTARALTIWCSDLGEAQRRANPSPFEAVLIRPLRATCDRARRDHASFK